MPTPIVHMYTVVRVYIVCTDICNLQTTHVHTNCVHVLCSQDSGYALFAETTFVTYRLRMFIPIVYMCCVVRICIICTKDICNLQTTHVHTKQTTQVIPIVYMCCVVRICIICIKDICTTYRLRMFIPSRLRMFIPIVYMCFVVRICIICTDGICNLQTAHVHTNCVRIHCSQDMHCSHKQYFLLPDRACS